MAENTKITFAESAIRDFEDVLDFYREKGIPHVGERLINRVFKEIELLASQPEMGRMVPEFELDYLRELIRPPFRIVYRRDLHKVRIVRVWRSERLLILPD